MSYINSEYINYTGGARGSDHLWEKYGMEYGITTKSMSFKGHTSTSYNNIILSDIDLQEGWGMVLISSNKMNRNINKVSYYIRRLLSRNWFQVKETDAVFAIGRIVKPNDKGDRYINRSNIELVDGGTGYAVMMAIDINKDVFVFDQYKKHWFKWDNDKFIECDIPVLTKRFTGIGTRDINEYGANAIKDVYFKTFNKK